MAKARLLEAYRNGELLPGFTFEEPITVTPCYTHTGVAGLSESTLELRYWDGSEWSTDGITLMERDTVNNRLVVTVAHSSKSLLQSFTFAEVPGVEPSPKDGYRVLPLPRVR